MVGKKFRFVACVILISVCAWIFYGCEKKCRMERVSSTGEPIETDGDSGTSIYPPPADTDYIPLDGDYERDPDMADAEDEEGSESVITDGDNTPSERDFDPSEFDFPENPPEKQVLPFDKREVVEIENQGIWKYTLENASRANPVSVATLVKDLQAEEPLFINEGSDLVSNPPTQISSVVIDSTLTMAVYRPFNADGRVTDPLTVIFRKTRVENGVTSVKFISHQMPEIENSTLLHVALMPDQTDSSALSLNIVAFYVMTSNSLIMVHRHTVSISDTFATLEDYKGKSDAQIINLKDGICDQTDMRSVVINNELWVNIGSAIHMFDKDGVYDNSLYPPTELEDVEKSCMIDFAVSADYEHFSTIQYIEYYASSTKEPETVWSVYSVSDAKTLLKLHNFGQTAKPVRLDFTPDGKYLVAIATGGKFENNLFHIDTDYASMTVNTSSCNSWGRPQFMKDPIRLIELVPYSTDEFATYTLEGEAREFSKIIKSSK